MSNTYDLKYNFGRNKLAVFKEFFLIFAHGSLLAGLSLTDEVLWIKAGTMCNASLSNIKHFKII